MNVRSQVIGTIGITVERHSIKPRHKSGGYRNPARANFEPQDVQVPSYQVRIQIDNTAQEATRYTIPVAWLVMTRK